MMIELCDCMNVILSQVADKHTKRKQVAITYAFCLMQSSEPIDWKKINAAIVARWSPSAREWIAKEAWKLIAAKQGEPK